MAKDALDARAFLPPLRQNGEAGANCHYQHKPDNRQRHRLDLAYRASLNDASRCTANLNLLCDALLIPADALTGYISWLRDKHAAGAPLRRLIAANMKRYREAQHAKMH